MNFIFLTFKSPGEYLPIPFINLRWYGLLIAIAIIIGLNLSNRLASKKEIEKDLINDLFPILIFSSIIGARIYYVLFEWDNYSGFSFWSKFNLLGISFSIPRFLEIWGGGIAIHGALIAGTLSVMIFCKLRNQSFLNLLDVLVPSVALGQAIGRWGNFFNSEAFGIPTNLPWKLYIEESFRPMIFKNYDFFHPTFLYESLWNLGVFSLLIILLANENQKRISLSPGFLSCIYLTSYSIGRFWIEGLRIDPLCLQGTGPFCEGGLRIAQLISLFFIGMGTLGAIQISRKRVNSKSYIRNRSQN